MIDNLQRMLHRFRSMLRPGSLDQDFDAELAVHLDMATEENLHRGMSIEEARRQALIRLGGSTQAKEEHRRTRGLPSIESFFQDVRYATRGLLKSPAFTAASVLTLALGIAINATMFSLVSGYMMQRPPGREPQRVAVVTSVNPSETFLPDINPISVPNYLAWRKGNDVFEDVAAADHNRMASLTWRGHTQAVGSAVVSTNYFAVLDVTPKLGRVFQSGDDQAGHDHVVILSHQLWTREFSADSSIVGQTIRINREDYTIVGVMPQSFRMMGFIPQMWTPLRVSEADQTTAARKDRSLYLFARMKPWVTIAHARAEVAGLARRASEDFPGIEKGWGASARTLPDFLIYEFGIAKPLAVMMTVVGFVLLIGCANVAGLLLARATGRRKELAIRMSLGAGRLRIVRQLLTEGLIIAFLGGATGLLLAYWGINFVRNGMAFNDVVRDVPVSLDTNVLFFALGVSFLSAVLCSLVPAITASRTDVNSQLKDEGRAASAGRSHSRFRSILVTAEISAAVFLLIGTGLLLRAVFLVERQDLGFDHEHLLTAGITLDKARYSGPAQDATFVKNLLPHLRQIPGAESVAICSELPANGPNRIKFQIQGQPEQSDTQRPSALDIVVTADYLRTARIPLLRGRLLTDADDASANRVVLVNQEFTRRFLKTREPLGVQIELMASSPAPEWSQIVGVVGNVKTFSMDTHEDPEIYEPYFQRPVPSFSLLLRSESDPDELAASLQRTVMQADPELPLSRVMSMASVFERQSGGSTFFVGMLATFALLAMLLSAVGINGLISYSVGQRKHEIAIRMAMGASAGGVRRMVLWEGLKMAALGAGIGVGASLPLPLVFAAIFDGLQTGSSLLYMYVPVAIMVVAILAAFMPAQRASAIDPITALHAN